MIDRGEEWRRTPVDRLQLVREGEDRQMGGVEEDTCRQATTSRERRKIDRWEGGGGEHM